MMPNPKRSLPLLLFMCFVIGQPLNLKAKEVMKIPIGLILDLNSTVGGIAQSFISMALQDFYNLHHHHYRTRLVLKTQDSKNDVVTAAFAAKYLIDSEKVHAIMGPQTSEEARFVIELGSKAEIPILSFSATSPSLSPISEYPYFIRTAHSSESQVEAIAAIVKAFGWYEVVLIYEDSEYGKGLIPYLNDAFVGIDTCVTYRSVIHPDSEEPEILKELEKLNQSLTRIFVVHMTTNIGSKFFTAVNKMGMMKEGYGWIVTEGLSGKLDPLASKVMESMEGVLGVRPLMVNTKRHEIFRKRWKDKSFEPTLFGLWAYDTIWALAMAVENVRVENVTLVNSILGTKFLGVSGNFRLVKGQLEQSGFEIFNVREGRQMVIGEWTKQTGDKFSLKQPIMWPGKTEIKPPKLRIGTPARQGTNEFKKLKNFSFDVFHEVLYVLPFPLSFEFVPFEKDGQTAGTYDELIMQIKNQKVDAVVGDVTIVANRSNYVDFTLPFSQSAVSMVVSVKHDSNMWVFLKPFSLELWLTTGASFIFLGFTVWFLEHRSNTDFRGTPRNQLGTVFWFSFSTLVFAHKEKIENKLSRLVLIIWVFVVLIITQSYTASLASILTVQRLQPAFMDIKEIKANGYCVGFQKRSFVKGILKEDLGFNESMLKGFDSPEDYHQALSLGSNNGGVDAIFDEIFFLKLFLAKYGSAYKMVGPTYKTDGLGFAFPLNSPLVSHFSRAILNVTEDTEKLKNITSKYPYLSDEIMPEDHQNSSVSSDSPSLTVKDFGGLFIIKLAISLLSIIVYAFKSFHSKLAVLRTFHSSNQISLWANLTEMAVHFNPARTRASPAFDGRNNQENQDNGMLSLSQNSTIQRFNGLS